MDIKIYNNKSEKVKVGKNLTNVRDINGELKECALVFTDNGSDFHLEPVWSVK